MRPFIILASFAVIVWLAGLGGAMAQTGGGTKGDPPGKKAKAPPVTKKTDPTPIPSAKGTFTLHSKDFKLPPLKTKPPQTKQYRYHTEQLKSSINSGNLKIDAGQKAALNKLTSQQPLTYDERQQLSDLLFKGSKAGLTAEDEAALSYLLTDDLARYSDTAGAPEGPKPAATGPLFLRVVNKTTEPIKVFVQVVAKDPSESAAKAAALETMKYELKPGLAYDLQDKTKQRIKANTIRIWAVSPTRQWASNRDHDLTLTASNASKVFVVTFAPQATTMGSPGGAISTAAK